MNIKLQKPGDTQANIRLNDNSGVMFFKENQHLSPRSE